MRKPKRPFSVIDQKTIRWPWRQKFHQQVTFDWGSLAWVFLLGIFFWIGAEGVDLRSVGLMDSVAVSHGQWWRLFTAVFLHADLAHLAMNASLGLLLLGLTMGRFGTGVGLLAAYLAGAGGNVATWLIFPEHRSLGASGMVMGCLGLLAAQAFTFRSHPHALRYWISGILGRRVPVRASGAESRLGCARPLRRISQWASDRNAFASRATTGSEHLGEHPAGATFSALVITAWWLALAVR